ncbi:Putative leucine-rich repeat domain superfamily [Septoria linicola]|uniref:Leucine-rich repeat domain superfamily n=1 Tax=Septoria linicola TaxID=215465 RepID=A0A9Q9AY77_9PEZI|nr:Putative leucine-rich repeat domain superfamily [Septoria linicola]
MACFTNLPHSIIRTICLYISDCRAFGLVSRACVEPARSVLFDTISITFYDTRDLGNAALAWAERLELVKSFQHVRTLRIVDEDTHPPIEMFHECGDVLSEKWQYLPDDHPDRIVDEAPGWQALAELLSRLPRLKDLVYAGPLQLHPCVVQCLEDILPTCRLHLETFCLRSLLCSPHQQIDFDPYENKLATHPQLHSVKIARFDEYDDGVFDFHLDALSDMVRGLAPNLRIVSLLREKPGSSPQLLRTKAQTRLRWTGSELGSLPSEYHGNLTSLELAGPGSATLAALQRWSEVTTLSRLEELRLHECIGTDTVDWLSTSCSLARVSKLTIHPASGQIAGLFRTIGNLTELKLVGNFDNEQIYGVLRRHGTSPKHLSIIPSFVHSTSAADMAETIARLCPGLTKYIAHVSHVPMARRKK